MPWLLKAGAFLFDNPLGKILGAAVLVLGVLTAFVSHERSIGAERAVAKIVRQNDKAAKAGKRAADRARDERVRGQRDPWTRDE